MQTRDAEAGGDQLVRELMRPEAYPAPRPAAVELRQTHASWVFLTEREAWKLKRPVDHGFLDYSDAEKRRRCCDEEVRLGRRLAPDVYLGVVDVHRGAGGHTFVGEEPVVDHAVRMRRLPDEESAQALLAAGRLGPAHLSRLAERLAEFYDAAPALAGDDLATQLRANIEENQRQTLPFAGRFVDGGLVEELSRWQLERATELEPELRGRVTGGRVREGHGDVRLEHAYFPGGLPDGPLVIDPIEFNRGFRCVDAALDVAFLAMELDAAARPELASWFLASFARAANDYDFYPLVDLYCSYRAWVRAKVACFVAADRSTAPAKATRKAGEAAALLALAASYARPSRQPPRVLVVSGMIGAGKSTLAEALCQELGFPVVSSDATRKHLFGLRPDQAGSPALYSDEATARTYAEVFRRGRAVLRSGRGVILDAAFRSVATRARARAMASKFHCPFLLVELDADDQLLLTRLRARHRTVSDAREALLPSFRSTYRPAHELPASEHLALDGAAPLDQLVRRIKDALARS
jgi:aminoglycoside phosphotransferase family enzyme/predicted kinase